MSNTVKPGWKTSEFYATAIVALIATINLFLNVGILNETINTAVSLATLVGAVAFYIGSRTHIKKAAHSK
jgi:hypothetical protein